MKLATMNPSKWSIGSLALALTGLIASPSRGQQEITMMICDDKPGNVQVEVQAKAGPSGAVLATQTLYWSGNNNSFSRKTITVPAATTTVRLTFRNDHCGFGCPANQDADRNAFVDWIEHVKAPRVDGFYPFVPVRVQGEDYDRDGGTDSTYPGVSLATINGRLCAGLGNQNDWAEYDLTPVSSSTSGGRGGDLRIDTMYPNAPVMLVLGPRPSLADRGTDLVGDWHLAGLWTDFQGNLDLPLPTLSASRTPRTPLSYQVIVLTDSELVRSPVRMLDLR